MLVLRYTFRENSRLIKYNDCDDKGRALHQSVLGEKRTIVSAKRDAGAPGVKRIEVLDKDDNVIWDSDS